LALLVVVGVYLVVPLVAVLLYSVATRWTAHILPDGYTWEYWKSTASDSRVLTAFGRSALLGAATVVIDLVLVAPVAYWEHVRNPQIRTVLEPTALVPFAVPLVVIGYGLLLGTSAVAPVLQGTPWLLILAHSAICFPFLYWALQAAMASIDLKQLVEAAATCGARSADIVRHVVAPNIRPGIATGSILVFTTSFNEFALAQLLGGAGYETLPLWSYEALTRTQGQFNELAVVAVASYVLLLCLGWAVFRHGPPVRLLPTISVLKARQ
jgi:putative spermidine/putrescine transport system permease protein